MLENGFRARARNPQAFLPTYLRYVFTLHPLYAAVKCRGMLAFLFLVKNERDFWPPNTSECSQTHCTLRHSAAAGVPRAKMLENQLVA